jgi:hypothetical protein
MVVKERERKQQDSYRANTCAYACMLATGDSRQ